MGRIQELVKLTEEMVSCAGQPAWLHEAKLENLRTLLGYDSHLDSIFMPETTSKRLDREGFLAKPPRWGDPLVRRLLANFKSLWQARDDMIPSDISTDPVYCQVVNPDIKALFEQRKGAAIYQKYAKYYTAPASPSLMSGEKSVHLTVAPKSTTTTELDLRRQREQKLENCPLPILALEARLSVQTVRRLKTEGLTGPEIVEFSYILHSRTTTGQAIREIRQVAVGGEDWEDVIDLSRHMRMSVRSLCRFLIDVEFEELCGVFNEFAGIAQTISEKKRRSEGWAWYLVIKTYIEKGRSLDRTHDMLDPYDSTPIRGFAIYQTSTAEG